MSDDINGDATPTEPAQPLELADQQPVDSGQVAPKEGAGSRKVLLGVIGAVAAVVLLLAAGLGGYAIAKSGNDDRVANTGFSQGGPDAGAPGFMDERGRDHRGMDQRGNDQRGIDPDGDNWMGGGRDGGGMMDQRGMDPRGMDPRGIDPDGDNWTGQNQQGGPMMMNPNAPGGPGFMDPRGVDPDGDNWMGGN